MATLTTSNVANIVSHGLNKQLGEQWIVTSPGIKDDIVLGRRGERPVAVLPEEVYKY